MRKITDSYGGSCIGLADIRNVLRDVTKVYLNAGYVSTRVYIPGRDIAVVEGRVSDIFYNGQASGHGERAVAGAFPGLKGKVVNMRDIEQGLDQMNRLASNNARGELLPGVEEGSTILNVSMRRTNAGGSRFLMTIWGRFG